MSTERRPGSTRLRRSSARMWLLAALNACGRYLAPESPEQPADLEDGGGLVDSIVLTAVLQRHFLRRAAPACDDATLARDLGLDPGDLARTQRALDAVLRRPIHVADPTPIGPRYWRGLAGS